MELLITVYWSILMDIYQIEILHQCTDIFPCQHAVRLVQVKMLQNTWFNPHSYINRQCDQDRSRKLDTISVQKNISFCFNDKVDAFKFWDSAYIYHNRATHSPRIMRYAYSFYVRWIMTSWYKHHFLEYNSVLVGTWKKKSWKTKIMGLKPSGELF